MNRQPEGVADAVNRSAPASWVVLENVIGGVLHCVLPAALDRLLLVEQLLWQCVNRERYLVYQQAWKAFYRDWQRDRIGEWPTSEPFLQQHHRVCEAVRVHALPPAPLASEVTRSEVFDRVAMPLDAILP